MELWAVSMVKDELDIIEATVRHLESEGVDGIIIADNMSSDGTFELLKSLTPDCEWIVKRDTDPAYYQSRKMTDLAHFAFRAGADWVIPFDADELWHNPNGTVREIFTTAQDEGTHCIEASLHNYFPTSDDDLTQPNPFLRITHRDPTPAPLPKVAVARRSDVIIEQGNHGATATEPFVRCKSPLEVAHFPWRSRDQFVNKARNGAKAYRQTSLPVAIGAHWRQYGEILTHQGPEALATVYDTHFFDPAMRLDERPAPWCKVSFSQS